MTLYIADERPDIVSQFTMAHLVVKRLEGQGELLDCGYRLFQRVFDSSVLDPKSVYDDRMSDAAFQARDFYPCFTIAYFCHGSDKIVAGFLSADLMWLLNDPKRSILALGNIATAPILKSDLCRKNGLRGVGSMLLNRATQDAKSVCQEDDRELAYLLSEAEPASLGFWKKAGFRWPQGCSYLQPPLEFDAQGTPLYLEVPETLLLAPQATTSDFIEPSLVENILRTLFENWCLRGWRDTLSPEAIRRAEHYVMDKVLAQIVSTMPLSPLPLIEELPQAARTDA